MQFSNLFAIYGLVFLFAILLSNQIVYIDICFRFFFSVSFVVYIEIAFGYLFCQQTGWG